MRYPCTVTIIIVILLSLSQIFSNKNYVVCWRKSECRSHLHPLGFSEYPDLQVPLFLVFLTVYAVTVVGNLGMITIIRISPKLHTLMYFLLSHLSFVDFCHSTTVTLKLLENLIVEERTISFTRCIMQYFSACMFAAVETFMLAVTAYDWFVAICKPLLYTVVMSPELCALLVACPYT